MRSLCAVSLLASLALTSCVTYRLVPQQEGESTIRYDRGKQTLSQLNGRVGVAVSAEVSGNLIYFHTIVKNFREESFYVDDLQTRLTEHIPQDVFLASLKVYSADEYYRTRRGQIVAGQVLMAVSAAMASSNAGRSSSYTSGTYSVYGRTRNNYYRGYGTYSSTTYTYDSAKAAMERDIAFSNVREYINGTNQELEFLRNTLFYPSDIDAGGEYYGIIVSDLGTTANATMTLSLVFAGVPFTFTFHKEQLAYGDY